MTKARSAAMQAQGAEAKGKAENALAGTLKSLFAVAENMLEYLILEFKINYV